MSAIKRCLYTFGASFMQNVSQIQYIFKCLWKKVSGIQRIKFRFWSLYIYNLRKLLSRLLFVSAKKHLATFTTLLFSPPCVFSWCDCASRAPAALITSLCARQVFVCLWKGCKVYNTPSTSQSWLQRHMLTHSGDKPFKVKQKTVTVNVSRRCGSLFLSYQIKCLWRSNTAFLSGASVQLINCTKATQVQKIRYKLFEMIWKSFKWSIILHMQIWGACCAVNEFWQFVTHSLAISCCTVWLS